jgi:hypothetical protein
MLEHLTACRGNDRKYLQREKNLTKLPVGVGR